MPSKEEKRRRAEIVEALVAEDTKKAIEEMPISFKDLGALFDHLDIAFENDDCDHTLKITKVFIENRNLQYGKNHTLVG